LPHAGLADQCHRGYQKTRSNPYAPRGSHEVTLSTLLAILYRPEKKHLKHIADAQASHSWEGGSALPTFRWPAAQPVAIRQRRRKNFEFRTVNVEK
jgi:hypothetical protein